MKYLAIDLGLKRIGLAYSCHKDIVTPLEAVQRKNRNQAACEVKAVVAHWGIETIIMGIPMGGSSEEEMRRRAAHFLALLEFDGAIFYQDESHSSQEAESLMRGEVRQIRDGRIDSLAAKIILERFLASRS